MAYILRRHEAIGRLLDALGILHSGVRSLNIDIRFDAAVKVVVVCERLLHEEELDAVADFLSNPDVQPAVEVREEEVSP